MQEARIYTCPQEPVPIYVSGFGTQAAELAGRIGDGFCTTMPDADLVKAFREGGGGDKPVQAGTKVSWDRGTSEPRTGPLEEAASAPNSSPKCSTFWEAVSGPQTPRRRYPIRVSVAVLKARSSFISAARPGGAITVPALGVVSSSSPGRLRRTC